MLLYILKKNYIKIQENLCSQIPDILYKNYYKYIYVISCIFHY